MTRPDEDDRAAIDRAFAEMMAGYHLTAERPLDVTTEDAAPARVMRLAASSVLPLSRASIS